MKRRIPSLNEFITATNNLGYDGQVTNMTDTVRRNVNLVKLNVEDIPSLELRELPQLFARELGIAFRNKEFGFESDYNTYVTIDIEDSDETKFEEFLLRIGIQFDKIKGFKILLTPDNKEKVLKIKGK